MFNPGARRRGAQRNGSLSLWAFLLAAGLAVCGGGQAQATTAMAQREGRACQYCHVSGSPGTIYVATGARQTNDLSKRGLYYGRHNGSFEGYVESAAPVSAAPNLLRFISRDLLPDSARRMAVADVTGDRTPRLITLNAKPDTTDSSVLTVKKWDGKAFVTEFRADALGAPDKLAVGRFTPDGKTVIVTARAVWFWNGKTYANKASTQTMNLIGMLRLPTDSTDNVLAMDAGGEVSAYSVDVGPGSDVLTNGRRLSQLTGGDITRFEMRGTPEFFSKLQMPPAQTQGGIFGLVAGGKGFPPVLYHVDPDQVADATNVTGSARAQAAPKILGWKVSVDNLRRPSLSNSSYTPRLAGEIYDVATENPRGSGIPGLLVLTSGTPDGKGRSLYFFALDNPAATNVIPAAR